MLGDIGAVDLMMRVFFWISPVIFAVGIMLIFASQEYEKIEEILGRQIGGIKMMIISKIETNVNNFQKWLLNNRVFVGLLLIIYFLVFWIMFGKKANIL